MAHVKEIAQDIVDVRYKEIMKLIEANEQSSEIDKVHRTIILVSLVYVSLVRVFYTVIFLMGYHCDVFTCRLSLL